MYLLDSIPHLITFAVVYLKNIIYYEKRYFYGITVYCYCALYSLHLANGKCVYKSNISSLLLENIEALAADEDGSDDGEVVGGKIRCIDVGSLDCPLTHEKVKYIVRGYSL